MNTVGRTIHEILDSFPAERRERILIQADKYIQEYKSQKDFRKAKDKSKNKSQ